MSAGRPFVGWRFSLAALTAFFVLAAILTYPQIARLQTSVADHPDPLFSVWRLAWVAHQLRADPAHLFDANIFYPERATFAYSDAMLAPAIVIAPLFWLRVPAITIYNVALLGALALSGFTMFLLCRTLTGDGFASFAGGVVYAFAPYRFEQYVHLEMQMVFWIPLVVLVAHRLVAGRRVRDGLLLGLLMTAQVLSGVYGAAYFAVSLAVLLPGLVIATAMRKPLRLAPPLAAATLVAIAVSLPYLAHYARASEIAGPRAVSEIQHYGASLASYLAAPPANRLYGWTAARFGAEELYLFPGLTAAALAVAALVARRSRVALAYVALLAFCVEASRGFDGWIYRLLYEYVPPLRGLRVPARFDLIANLAIGVLAAFGLVWLRSRYTTRATLLSVLLIAAMAAEYASSPALATVSRPSLADRWLATQPRGVAVELPLPRLAAFWPNHESRFMYEGTVHWLPMLNGYSGFFPESYVELLSVMESFPDARSLDYIRARGVDYLFVRGSYYEADERERIRMEIERSGRFALLAGFPPPGLELIFVARGSRP